MVTANEPRPGPLASCRVGAPGPRDGPAGGLGGVGRLGLGLGLCFWGEQAFNKALILCTNHHLTSNTSGPGALFRGRARRRSCLLTPLLLHDSEWTDMPAFS